MTKKKKFYHYVLVFTDEGPKFVTSVDRETKTAHWDSDGKPLDIYPDDCDYMVLGLQFRKQWAFHVVQTYELETQCYDFSHGNFKWVDKKPTKTDKKVKGTAEPHETAEPEQKG